MVKKNKSSRIFACYCVPTFIEYSLLYKYLCKGKLLDHSKFLIPTIEINDTKRHHVTFDSSHACQFSTEPNDIVYLSIDELFETQETLNYNKFANQSIDKNISLMDNLNNFLIKNKLCLIIKIDENNEKTNPNTTIS